MPLLPILECPDPRLRTLASEVDAGRIADPVRSSKRRRGSSSLPMARRCSRAWRSTYVIYARSCQHGQGI